MRKLSFITGSLEKFQEAKLVLPSLDRINLDLPEIQELDQKKIIEAKLKVALDNGLDHTIVEDTGLYFESLGSSLPGPLIKWFVKAVGNEGLIKLALDLNGQSKAYALTTIAYLSNAHSSPLFYEGKLEGRIVAARGSGFGWDAIFQPTNSKLTLGEMSSKEKTEISHRGLAFKQLAEFLKSN